MRTKFANSNAGCWYAVARTAVGAVAESARTLGVARGYLHRLIKQLEIEAEELNPPAEMATKVAAGRVM